MNLLLLSPDEVTPCGKKTVISDPRRLRHLHEILNTTQGDILRAGLIGGLMGSARVLSVETNRIELHLYLSDAPPRPIPMTLILAMPRPKSLKKVLWAATTFGIKAIHLIHSARTDKAYWQSALLQPDTLRQELITALEQARDTLLPEVIFHPKFRPFAEDILPLLAKGKRAFLLHPTEATPCPANIPDPQIFAIGAEGGWVPFELDCFTAAGFERVHFGERILRVEQAVCAAAARLSPLY